MAKNDIRVWRQVDFGIVPYPLASGTPTFVEGDLVVVGVGGTLSECADDPTAITGIAAGSSQNTARAVGGATLASGTQISVYGVFQRQLFVTENLAEDGAGTLVTPLVTHIGDQGGFTLNGGAWSLDTGATNTHVEITDVLDANHQSLGDATVRTAGTGVFVIFGF